ncbi:MAG: hypothetical protein QW818_03940 [Candidatus Aenigmatarchaeota archaeon]|nr:hypothetical protein [Candidatus Aenigmarchaeota archaeon]
MNFILIYDIPTELESVQRQTHRLLVRNGCKQIQRSVWKSEELSTLMDIAIFVKKSGGDARILEEKFVF